jgi:hypothetical protein
MRMELGHACGSERWNEYSFSSDHSHHGWIRNRRFAATIAPVIVCRADERQELAGGRTEKLELAGS